MGNFNKPPCNIKATLDNVTLSGLSNKPTCFKYLENLSGIDLILMNSRHIIIRSSDRRCSIKKGVLRNFVKFTGKSLRQSLFFNKVAGLRCATLLKNRLWHRCFPVNFIKLLKTPFLKNTSGRLLLTLKCIYEKKQPSRNHVEIMFVFEIFHEEDQILPRK